MREVVIQSWCDECITNGDQVAGIAFDISWRNRDVSLDLCEKHASPVYEVDRLVAAYGHSKKSGTKKKLTLSKTESAPEGKRSPSDAYLTADGEYQCPSCDRVFNNPQGLGSHRYKQHGHRRAS